MLGFQFSDGAPHIRMYKFLPKDISILRLGEMVTFSVDKITDVAEPTVVDSFVAGSSLYMLVGGLGQRTGR